MNLLRSFFRILAGAIGIAAFPCSAQQEATYSLQFMTFPMTVEPLQVEMLVGEGKTILIDVPSNELGPIVRVPVMASLVFGETVLDDESKPQFKIYGQGKPDSARKQLVLLLRKGGGMAEGFEVRAISSDIKKFSGGKFLFINAAKIDIGGKAGNAKFALKPGDHSILKPGLEPNGRLTHVEFFYSNSGQAIPFFSSMWPVAKEYRALIFFYHDPNHANKIQLHTFRHFLE